MFQYPSGFTNDFGEYSYKSISEDLMFGYNLKPLADGRTLQIAKPEKALLDLLYLYPFYTSEKDFEELRLDDDFLQGELDINVLNEYALKFENKALEKRVKLLINTYGL